MSNNKKIKVVVETIKQKLSNQEQQLISVKEIAYINAFILKFEKWMENPTDQKQLEFLGDSDIGLFSIKEIEDSDKELSELLCDLDYFIDKKLKRNIF